MVPVLDHVSIVENQNAITIDNARQPVGQDQSCAAPHQSIKRLENDCFILCIHSG